MSVDGLLTLTAMHAVERHRGAPGVTHQIGMTNLLTRAGWQARVADPALHPPPAAPGEEGRIAHDERRGERGRRSLLFVDEAPLTDAVRGQSGFAERFAASAGSSGPIALSAGSDPARHEIPDATT
jgi:hypothetical protein